MSIHPKQMVHPLVAVLLHGSLSLSLSLLRFQISYTVYSYILWSATNIFKTFGLLPCCLPIGVFTIFLFIAILTHVIKALPFMDKRDWRDAFSQQSCKSREQSFVLDVTAFLLAG